MTTTTTQSWSFDLSLSRPLSLNDREHHMARYRRSAQLRGEAMMMAKVRRIPHCRKVRITLTWTPSTQRRRDVDNLAPTLKAITDGLVDAKVIPDDTPAHVEQEVVVAEPRKGVKRPFFVAVERLV